MSDEVPQFPNYEPPNPKGIPLPPHPTFHKPLMKVINRMGKRTKSEKPFTTSHRRTKKKDKHNRFY